MTGDGPIKAKIMETPDEIVEKAQPALDTFYNLFPLRKEDKS